MKVVDFMTDQEVRTMEQRFGANHYDRREFVPRKAEGVWLFGSDGKCFDCLSAYSAANQGHLHPFIVNACKEAMDRGEWGVVSGLLSTPPMAKFLEELATLPSQLAPRFGDHGNKVLLKNGGVESVETALKQASDYGYRVKGIEDGKQEIVVFYDNFHGRTKSVVAFSSNQKYKEGFGLGINSKAYRYVNYGDLEGVKNIFKNGDGKNVCGILVEPMQGEGGMNVPPKGFLKGLRELADEHDLILIFDEIQVGMGRTGKMFCFEHENVIPDVLILGKAISGGMVPVSACISSAYLMSDTFYPGRDGSTYGGYPGACIAGLAALEVIKKEGLVENSHKMGKIFMKKLKALAKRSSIIKEVRGRGLFIGIEVHGGDANKYCKQLFKEGLFVNDSHGHTIRMSPPLIINKKDIDYIVERLEKVLCDK